MALVILVWEQGSRTYCRMAKADALPYVRKLVDSGQVTAAAVVG